MDGSWRFFVLIEPASKTHDHSAVFFVLIERPSHSHATVEAHMRAYINSALSVEKIISSSSSSASVVNSRQASSTSSFAITYAFASHLHNSCSSFFSVAELIDRHSAFQPVVIVRDHPGRFTVQEVVFSSVVHSFYSSPLNCFLLCS